MKKADARLIVRALVRAVRERFTRKEDHAALVARVANLERELAQLRKQQEGS